MDSYRRCKLQQQRCNTQQFLPDPFCSVSIRPQSAQLLQSATHDAMAVLRAVSLKSFAGKEILIKVKVGTESAVQSVLMRASLHGLKGDQKGPMPRRTMLLSDSLTVRQAAVRYAVELAKRTNHDLVLLVLLSFEDQGQALEYGQSASQLAFLAESLRPHVDRARAAGVQVDAMVKVGDRSSELVKFLAAAGSFETIVWGGDHELTRGGMGNESDHWLVKLRSVVDCPIVVPARKA